jgi:ABC-type antimicrobial peptide transport system permease subunit
VAGVALIGLGFGVAGALLAAQAMRSVLFGIGPADPLALAGAVVLLAAGILAAALVPARRAATVDPLIAMRVE